jgi:hypothetical protein
MIVIGSVATNLKGSCALVFFDNHKIARTLSLTVNLTNLAYVNPVQKAYKADMM